MRLTAETKLNDKCHLDRRLDNAALFGDFYWGLGLRRTAEVEATKVKKKKT